MLVLDSLLEDADPPVPAGISTETGRRTRPVDELRADLTPYFKDYGITRVAHLTGFDYVGLPVHMAVKPQGRSLSSGSGKGLTTDASWVSAVMECCEQAVWANLEVEKIEASRSMLQRMGVTVADGNLLPQARGSMWNEDLPIEWVAGWDIVSGDQVWVPAGLVTLQAAGQGRLNPFVSGSNGLASGAHVVEAILSGLQEVIERDGLVLRTVIDPAPSTGAMDVLWVAAPGAAELIERSGLYLEVVDATTEVGVPIVAAYLFDQKGGTAGTFKGMGAGVSRAMALTRAVTEAAQSRCLIIAGARDDIFETTRAASVSSPAVSRAALTSELPAGEDFSTGTVVGDLEWMVSRLIDSGFPQVIVVRHSLPGDPVQVVRVLVPGLEGYPFAYGKTGLRAASWSLSGQQSKVEVS